MRFALFFSAVLFGLAGSVWAQGENGGFTPCSRQQGVGGVGRSSGDIGSRGEIAGFQTDPKIDPNNAPLRIVNKPIAHRTDDSDCTEGVVRLRIEFRPDGTTGNIRIVSGLTKGLNRDAIDAARKIRFEPATKNGMPIGVLRTLEYNFSIY